MKKEIDDTLVRDISKNRIVRNISNFFKHEEDYYKPVRVSSF